MSCFFHSVKVFTLLQIFGSGNRVFSLTLSLSLSLSLALSFSLSLLSYKKQMPYFVLLDRAQRDPAWDFLQCVTNKYFFCGSKATRDIFICEYFEQEMNKVNI
jgi:hypothetical protein